jgi:heat shock protein HtpX
VGTVIALLLGSGQAWWGMRFGDQAVLSAASAVPINPSTNDPQQRQLLNIVEEIKIASGLPMPIVYLIPDADPNAFATGRDPDHASIAVTRGLVEKLNREELQGVIAHEMSHIRNLDIRLMTTMAALVGGIALLSDWAARSMRFGGGRSRSSGRDKSGGGAGMILLVLWILAVILAPILAQILAMSVSREREYLADASGAELTRNPAGLASALKKIEMDHMPTHAIKRGTAHLCIADPLGRKVGLREGFVADLLATHPPMPHRISKLMQMAYQASPHPAAL